MNCRSRMLAACTGEKLDRPPIWMMRQAGRYLPEYRALRQEHSFWEMVRKPEVAVEATLQPLRRFPVDASIIFSDILTVLDAMGAQVTYETGGPIIGRPCRSAADILALKPPDIRNHLFYVGEAVTLLCAHVHPERAVIGFAGAPLTLAAYLVEGGANKDLRTIKSLFYNEPALAHRLLDILADAVADLLLLQIEAGADIVQVFDTWAGLIGPDEYEAFALPATQRVMNRVRGKVPTILYLRGAAGHLEAASRSGCDVLSLDTSIRISEARLRLRGRCGIQGNLDPAELLGPSGRIRDRVRSMVEDAGHDRYIVNLGQGLFPEAPIAGVEALVDAVVNL